NGEPRTLADTCTVADLLQQEHIAGHRVAIEVNGKIVTDAQYGSQALCDGDTVEVIHALGSQ
ncbi:MAG: sulfur carrier protein ThiS, partial [Pseudoxanthomonas sp.]